jgi:hypothetical protein
MVSQVLVDAWSYWAESRSPEEFMDHSRAQGYSTIGAAADGYVVELTGLHQEWAGLNAEELEEIRDLMMSYLHAQEAGEFILRVRWSWKGRDVPGNIPIDGTPDGVPAERWCEPEVLTFVLKRRRCRSS